MTYRVLVKPRDYPENYILDALDSERLPDLIDEVREYMFDLGIYAYEVINISRTTQHTVFFEDINLN